MDSLFESQTARENEKEESESYHLLIHHPNACNIWDWTIHKQGAGTQCTSHMWMARTESLELSQAASQGTVSRKLELRVELGLESRLSDTRYGHHKWSPNCYANACPYFYFELIYNNCVYLFDARVHSIMIKTGNWNIHHLKINISLRWEYLKSPLEIHNELLLISFALQLLSTTPQPLLSLDSNDH